MGDFLKFSVFLALLPRNIALLRSQCLHCMLYWPGPVLLTSLCSTLSPQACLTAQIWLFWERDEPKVGSTFQHLVLLSLCCALPQCRPWHLYISADDTAGNCYQTSQMPACLSLAWIGKVRLLSWNCFTWEGIRAAAKGIARRAAPRHTPFQPICIYSTAWVCSCSQWL